MDRCASAESLNGSGVLLSNFVAGKYKVEVVDNCFGPAAKSVFCAADFETTPLPASTDINPKMEITPNIVNFGESLAFTMRDIPKQDTLYETTIKLGNANRAQLVFRVEAGKCTIQKADTAFTTSTCSGNGPFTLISSIDTNAIGASYSSTIDEQYTVSATSNSGLASNLGTSSFRVRAPQAAPPTDFQITSFTPDPVLPGQSVTMSLDITYQGEYRYGINHQPVSSFKSTTCNTSPCDLTIDIPADTKVAALDALVISSNNSKTFKTFNIAQAGPTGAFATVTPIPTPTYPPPPPPCERWVRIDNNGTSYTTQEFYAILPFEERKNYRCGALKIGLGITIDTSPTGIVKSIFLIVLSLAGGIALVLIIYSGYQIVMSRGNPEKLQGARETITSAIVGLLFIIFSVAILQIIGIEILRIPGFQ